ncbi:MAG: hypothetical protein Q4D05_06615, partial [Acinetobacter sp.]|nr:hypothetical protein [Acinetobacter sp.]
MSDYELYYTPTRLHALLLCVALVACSNSSFASSRNVAQCYAAAYPETVQAIDDKTIKIHQNKTMPVGTVVQRPFRQMLNQPSLAEQIHQIYALDFHIPKQYEDAGRIRNDEFFKAMYGATLADVQRNMTTVKWQPSGTTIQFNRLNGAAAQLQKVGNEIAQSAELK